ncbi:Potassium voltage-gated channel subfamily C member 1 [Varanus komodoensis]|uniref:BTB domain-containing protein n=1 Tax=Varanus komodoensis TaxID=61221 RepID=A0A8D2Q0V9_VARKO|nr:potassium voltage-gated channel subfamily C member 1-like [Varanus komodoensis]XP_044293844.1 potassium voltage-gated channel subfamily C member 1-like [Varanus komodoensis]KAF7241996.1 Potassium voltage-gated channel subfamily C member 1 [Varanus komodoensis]
MRPAGEKVTLNVGGVRFETYSSTLRAFPGTKLCRLTEPQASSSFDYDPHAKEFFFDRNASLFDEVLSYYRSKQLHCPDLVCKSAFEEELAFWGIPDAPLAPCCQQKLSDAEGQEEEHNTWDEERDAEDQGLLPQQEGSRTGCRARWQPKIWALFEKPCSSVQAKCLAAISLLFNVGICVLFILNSQEQIHVIPVHHASHFHHNDTTYHHEVEYSFYKRFLYLLHLELFCVLWFMLEFSVRLTFCPDKKKFFLNPLNIADFLSLFPVYIELFSAEHPGETCALVCWLGCFRVLYFLKLLKILRLVEKPLMFRLLSYTFRSILREVAILLMVFAFEILFFGALCFYAEAIGGDPETMFDDITSSFWWAVVTVTTVGYGDTYPTLTLGKAIAACTAVCGVLTIIIPIPMFFIKFKGYYDAAVIKEKMKRMKAQMSTLPCENSRTPYGQLLAGKEAGFPAAPSALPKLQPTGSPIPM